MSEKLLSNHRKEITDPNSIWIVEEGRGELFLEKEEGPLIHLCSLNKGEIFFGFEKDPSYVVYFIAIANVTIRKIEMSEILSWGEEKASASILEWLSQFTPFFQTFQVDKFNHFLEGDKTYTIEAGETFKGALAHFPEHKKEIRWLFLEEGKALLFNLEGFSFEFGKMPYPMAGGMWFQAEQKSIVHTLSTEIMLHSQKLHEAIQAFQKDFLALRKHAIHALELSEIESAKARKIQDADMLQSSLKKIGSILSQEEEWGFKAISEPIYKACVIVGKSQDIHFLEPKDLSKVKSEIEKIELICRQSKVGLRQVKLVSEWWKNDSLGLLGFYGPEEKPVALVNRRGGNYIMIDPQTNEKTIVDEKVAKEIALYGYSFYAAFPEKKLDAKSIIHFCLSQYKKELVGLLVIGVAGALLSLLPPLFNEYLFNQVIRPYEKTLLPQLAWGLALSTISISIFLFVRSYAVLRLMQLIDVKLEPAIWSRLLSLPVSFFRQFTVGNLIQRVFTVTDIRQLIGGNVIRVVFSGIFSIFYFIAMLYYSVPLAFIGVGIVLSGLLVTSYCLYEKIKIERHIQTLDGIIRGTTVQLISGVSKIRINGAEARAFAYWSKDFSEYQDWNYRSRNYDRVINGITASLPILTTGILFVSLVTFSKGLSLGAFIAFLAAYVPFSLAVYDMITTANTLVPALPLWERAKILLETEPESESFKEKPGKLTGEVVVEDVSFRYEEEGPLILDNVSFHAQPGEFIALVGPSGSGKSTLVRLLLGFDTPFNGSVYYDGKNLSKLDMQDVRRQIGVVLQNGALFSGSIYENIVCGGLYTQKEIDEALALSGFDKDLETFPMGLYTVVQSGGGSLSVGQGQRLLISRALISKPKILIFDEATSALDNKTQDEVSRRLEKIDVTRIVIAHRLSTVRNATRVYVVDRGRIVQQGSFLDLAQQEGIFKEMFQRQML